jgi:NAD+ kinase
MRVVVVYKKSKLQLARENRNSHIAELMRKNDISVRAMVEAHDAHVATLKTVMDVLRDMRVPVRRVYRARLRPADCEGAHVVAVGGDGTVLDASHRVTTSAVLGVNSDPNNSVGFLCGTTAEDFGLHVRRFMNDEQCISVQRLGGSINGTPFPFCALNDALVSHHNPAATSRYLLQADGVEEDHRSSGIWVSTAAGSSAAMASAGGSIFALEDQRFQLRVREPFEVDGHVMKLAALQFTSKPIIVTSKMREGRVWLDGPYRALPFPMGARLRFQPGPPLRLYATEAMFRRRDQARQMHEAAQAKR